VVKKFLLITSLIFYENVWSASLTLNCYGTTWYEKENPPGKNLSTYDRRSVSMGYTTVFIDTAARNGWIRLPGAMKPPGLKGIEKFNFIYMKVTEEQIKAEFVLSNGSYIDKNDKRLYACEKKYGPRALEREETKKEVELCKAKLKSDLVKKQEVTINRVSGGISYTYSLEGWGYASFYTLTPEIPGISPLGCKKVTKKRKF